MPKPHIADSMCNRCATCVQVCPMGVLAIENNRIAAVNEDCIGCRACEAQCAKRAIELEE